jgi:hypothetical protein
VKVSIREKKISVNVLDVSLFNWLHFGERFYFNYSKYFLSQIRINTCFFPDWYKQEVNSKSTLFNVWSRVGGISMEISGRKVLPPFSEGIASIEGRQVVFCKLLKIHA